ncbi:NEAT domain-containing protein [Weissella confusa]|uniref:NEAT domain-containing protein n=1 Tax=Weissella confusa TaxID=1583 RepID=A0A923SMM8_WEICO|nr:NEAT domain-containing protein [Weissella confusa]
MTPQHTVATTNQAQSATQKSTSEKKQPKIHVAQKQLPTTNSTNHQAQVTVTAGHSKMNAVMIANADATSTSATSNPVADHKPTVVAPNTAISTAGTTDTTSSSTAASVASIATTDANAVTSASADVMPQPITFNDVAHDAKVISTELVNGFYQSVIRLTLSPSELSAPIVTNIHVMFTQPMSYDNYYSIRLIIGDAPITKPDTPKTDVTEEMRRLTIMQSDNDKPSMAATYMLPTIKLVKNADGSYFAFVTTHTPEMMGQSTDNNKSSSSSSQSAQSNGSSSSENAKSSSQSSKISSSASSEMTNSSSESSKISSSSSSKKAENSSTFSDTKHATKVISNKLVDGYYQSVIRLTLTEAEISAPIATNIHVEFTQPLTYKEDYIIRLMIGKANEKPDSKPIPPISESTRELNILQKDSNEKSMAATYMLPTVKLAQNADGSYYAYITTHTPAMMGQSPITMKLSDFTINGVAATKSGTHWSVSLPVSELSKALNTKVTLVINDAVRMPAQTDLALSLDKAVKINDRSVTDNGSGKSDSVSPLPDGVYQMPINHYKPGTNQASMVAQYYKPTATVTVKNGRATIDTEEVSTPAVGPELIEAKFDEQTYSYTITMPTKQLNGVINTLVDYLPAGLDPTYAKFMKPFRSDLYFVWSSADKTYNYNHRTHYTPGDKPIPGRTGFGTESVIAQYFKSRQQVTINTDGTATIKFQLDPSKKKLATFRHYHVRRNVFIMHHLSRTVMLFSTIILGGIVLTTTSLDGSANVHASEIYQPVSNSVDASNLKPGIYDVTVETGASCC